MESRQEIESILDQAYEARLRQDLDATEQVFCSDGRLVMNGRPDSPSDTVGRRHSIEELFSAMEVLKFDLHCRVIDPPRAVVHWRGRFRGRRNGQVADADILDLIEIRDGKIASLTSFFDTALAARLTS